jgi:hypothetical protein
MKNLIINPTKEESKNLKMLSVPSLVISLIEKVLRTSEAEFRPMVTQDHHTKTFITNVAYKLVPIQDYSGKELNSMQDAIDFYNEIANKIYGKYWMVELLKNEIRLSRDTNFGVKTEDAELVQYIQRRLSDTDSNVTVWYNMPHSSMRPEETDKSEKKSNKTKLNAKKEIENV